MRDAKLNVVDCASPSRARPLADRAAAEVTRGPLMPGVILDSAYAVEPDGATSALRVSNVAVGPITEEEATGVRTFGDLARFGEALRKVIEG